MQYFMDTTETVPDGVGFSHFGMLHLIWLQNMDLCQKKFLL